MSTSRGSALELGQPVVKIQGYSLMRAAYQLLYVAPPEDEQVVKWRLQPGIPQGGQGQPLIIGDLTSRSEDSFAGVQVAAFLTIEGVPQLSEDDWEAANEITSTYAGHVSDGLYDFASQAMRAMTAGAHFPPEVPHRTPQYELRLASADELAAAEDRGAAED